LSAIVDPGLPAAAPIRRRKLYEEVAREIERLIRDGGLAPGDRLPSEREFTERFRVGRSAVREALLSLQKMGLVAVSSGERARVAEPTAKAMVGELSGAARLLLSQPDGVRRFQEARLLFEVGLARMAAQRRTEADLAVIREALDANRRAIGDHPAFIRTDVAFHHAIARVPGNPIFASPYEAVIEWLQEQRLISGRTPGAGEDAYAAHAAIYEAIAEGDAAAAEAAMQRHLETVAQRYWQVREDEGEGEHGGLPRQ
jgi:GntR family transcriptional regulator, sialic acid-inducible nan operon repressor